MATVNIPTTSTLRTFRHVRDQFVLLEVQDGMMIVSDGFLVNLIRYCHTKPGVVRYDIFKRVT